MKIIVNDRSEAKLAAAIDAAEGPRVKTRWMTTAGLTAGIRELDDRLRLICKKDQVGITAVITTGDTVPNSYRGTAQRAFVEVERFPSGWALVGAGREDAPRASYGAAENRRVESVSIARAQRDLAAASWLAGNRVTVRPDGGSDD